MTEPKHAKGVKCGQCQNHSAVFLREGNELFCNHCHSSMILPDFMDLAKTFTTPKPDPTPSEFRRLCSVPVDAVHQDERAANYRAVLTEDSTPNDDAVASVFFFRIYDNGSYPTFGSPVFNERRINIYCTRDAVVDQFVITTQPAAGADFDDEFMLFATTDLDFVLDFIFKCQGILKSGYSIPDEVYYCGHCRMEATHVQYEGEGMGRELDGRARMQSADR